MPVEPFFSFSWFSAVIVAGGREYWDLCMASFGIVEMLIEGGGVKPWTAEIAVVASTTTS